MSEGRATIRELVMNFREEGGRALAGGLIAHCEKTLIQPAARWLLTEPENSSASEAARKKGCHLFRSHSHRTK